MSWDLATAKLKLNITGTANDTEITGLMNTALALAEKYCDRFFLFKEEIVKFYDQTTDQIQLPRWPIETIFGTKGHNQIEHVHKSAGRLQYHRQQFIHELEVHYTGGFKQLPFDLELALWDLFNALWATYGPGAGGGGGATVAIGAVKKKTIVGVGAIEYETGGGSSSGGSAGGGAGDITTLVPGSTLAILDMYARKSA